MEIWEILDEQGNKTGKTMVKGESFRKGQYHLGSDVWIMNSDNKILIQKRSPSKRLDPNVWAMTGGSAINGEDSITTIKREALEELNIKLNESDLELVKKYKTGTVYLHVYFSNKDINLDDIVMQEEEVCDIKWASYDEIEEIYNNGQFMKNRWEYVRDLIKKRVN